MSTEIETLREQNRARHRHAQEVGEVVITRPDPPKAAPSLPLPQDPERPEAKAEQSAVPDPVADAAARRAAKPRLPLGQPHCPPCKAAEAERKAREGAGGEPEVPPA